MAVRLLTLLLCTLSLFAQEPSPGKRVQPEADRYRDAIRAADAVLETHPNDVEALHRRGESRLGLGELAEAEADLRRALELDPGHKEARFLLASTLELQGRGEGAEVEYRRLLAAHPADLEASVGLGALLIRRGEAEQALPLLRRSAGQAPDHFKAHLFLGRALAQANRLGEAVAPLRSAARLRPDSTEAHYQLALALRRLGRLEEARLEFEIVRELNERNRGTGMGMGPPRRRP